MEVLAPNEGQISVVACPHPFKVARTELNVPAGLTLAEILERVQPDPALLMGAYVALGDIEVPQENWHLVRPKSGARVIIRVWPGDSGGGSGKKTALRAVLVIAVIAASVYFPPAAGLEGFAAAAVGAGIALSRDWALNVRALP